MTPPALGKTRPATTYNGTQEMTRPLALTAIYFLCLAFWTVPYWV